MPQSRSQSAWDVRDKNQAVVQLNYQRLPSTTNRIVGFGMLVCFAV